MTDIDNLDKFLVSEAHLQLDAKRKEKAEEIKHLGEPITLPGKALGLEIRGQHAWIAENTGVARKVDIETGKTVQLYKGHAGPVTCLTFYSVSPEDKTSEDVLITGSWDKNIILWDTQLRQPISTTLAHSDFVKTLVVISPLKLLISGSSDRTVRLWDLSTPTSPTPLSCVGIISAHTRPVECIIGQAHSDTSGTLYTADTMGVIKVWHIERMDDGKWRCTMEAEHRHHRTKVHDMTYGAGWLWTASSDETVQLLPTSSETQKSNAPKPLVHPSAISAVLPLQLTPLGEPYLLTAHASVIRVYDLTTFDEPEVVKDWDGHWHTITALKFWPRGREDGGKFFVEPWIISASLDGTLRKWKVKDLLKPETKEQAAARIRDELKKLEQEKHLDQQFQFSAEEEKELDELMGQSDDD